MRQEKKFISSSRAILKICTVIALFIITSGVYSDRTGADKDGRVYKIIFVKNLFSEVNTNDAEAALRVWIKELARDNKIGFKLEPLIINSMNDLSSSLGKDILLINSTAVDFLEYRSKLNLEGAFVAIDSGSVYKELVLLAGKNVKDLKSLNSYRLGLQPLNDFSIANIWLTAILNENKLPEKQKFFKSIRETTRQAQMVMALFFGDLDACVVTKDVYNVMVELNPQIGKSIKVIKTSPGLVFNVTSFPKDIQPGIKKQITEITKSIMEYSGGKQVLTLMNTNNITTFQESYVDNLKTLVSQYKKTAGDKKN